MNKSEKDNLKLIEYQVKQVFVQIKEIKESNEIAHEEVKKDLRFIKNNLFDPKEGLWSEVKANTVFYLLIILIFIALIISLNYGA